MYSLVYQRPLSRGTCQRSPPEPGLPRVAAREWIVALLKAPDLDLKRKSIAPSQIV
jgi:hypothetical protein